jgi:hypothetical protein
MGGKGRRVVAEHFEKIDQGRLIGIERRVGDTPLVAHPEWPTATIEQSVRPTDQQHRHLDALRTWRNVRLESVMRMPDIRYRLKLEQLAML